MPRLVRTPLHAATRNACAVAPPVAVSMVTIKVGAQNVDDHRPKMMQAIIIAAIQVVFATPPTNSARVAARPPVSRPRCHAAGSGSRRRR